MYKINLHIRADLRNEQLQQTVYRGLFSLSTVLLNEKRTCLQRYAV